MCSISSQTSWMICAQPNLLTSPTGKLFTFQGPRQSGTSYHVPTNSPDMKTGRFLLWSVALLLAVHSFIAMGTLPEFHALSQAEFQQHLDRISVLSSASKDAVQME